jgi:hypothetical protein
LVVRKHGVEDSVNATAIGALACGHSDEGDAPEANAKPEELALGTQYPYSLLEIDCQVTAANMRMAVNTSPGI